MDVDSDCIEIVLRLYGVLRDTAEYLLRFYNAFAALKGSVVYSTVDLILQQFYRVEMAIFELPDTITAPIRIWMIGSWPDSRIDLFACPAN